MPALANPRHEAFAQAIFAGLTGKTRIERAQSTAYLQAYPNCAPGNAAEACASRLLRRAKPILDRVRELQAEANKRLEPKLDLSRERIGRNLDYASALAKQQGNAQAIVASELGIAKVFHRLDASDAKPTDFNAATSMQDIGKRLLESIGFREPDPFSIAEAVRLNNLFIEQLEAIRDAAGQLIDADE